MTDTGLSIRMIRNYDPARDRWPVTLDASVLHSAPVTPEPASSAGTDAIPVAAEVGPQAPADASVDRDYHAEPQRQAVVQWLKERHFIADGCLLVYCWSSRCGMDHVTLEFYPLARHANDEGWDAIVGHHASGTNPRMAFGTCETLADVQMAYNTIRLLNGYRGPEPERVIAPPLASQPHLSDTERHS